jgi:hypothetical protein
MNLEDFNLLFTLCIEDINTHKWQECNPPHYFSDKKEFDFWYYKNVNYPGFEDWRSGFTFKTKNLPSNLDIKSNQIYSLRKSPSLEEILS